MKNKSAIYTVLLAGLLFPLIYNCTKEDTTNSDQTPGTVTDIDGNVYHTVTIGAQIWMVENLKTTKYRDGSVIPAVSDSATWRNLSTGAYSNNSVDVSNSATYGRLYNWYAVNDNRKLAPVGWHVASDTEWTTLTTYTGGTSSGGKLKETGITHWLTPNTGATNETGFTALAGGQRSDTGANLNSIGKYGYWWTSTESGTDIAWPRGLSYNDTGVGRFSYHKPYGMSVRCIKD